MLTKWQLMIWSALAAVGLVCLASSKTEPQTYALGQRQMMAIRAGDPGMDTCCDTPLDCYDSGVPCGDAARQGSAIDCIGMYVNNDIYESEQHDECFGTNCPGYWCSQSEEYHICSDIAGCFWNSDLGLCYTAYRTEKYAPDWCDLQWYNPGGA